MSRILIIGGGPAGLACAESLLVEGGHELVVAVDRSYLGGKAASWEQDGGMVVENGQHITMGFYQELPALLARTGVSWQETTVPNDGRYLIWEDRDRRVHELHLGASSLGALWDGLRYSGFTFAEKVSFVSFVIRAMPRVTAGVPETLDDRCLSAWSLENGLATSIFSTNAFRVTRDAQLNWPGEISAYTMLKTIGKAARDFQTAEVRFPAGGMSRIWWEPLGRRIEALGGRILRMRRLVALERSEEGAVIPWMTRSLCADHEEAGACHEGRGEPWSGFDAVVVAIPPHALVEVLGRSPTLASCPELANIGSLRPVAPLGLHVWHKRAVTARHRTVLFGLPPPLSFLVDNKPFYAQYRDDTRFGSALHFVGQESGFSELDDEELLRRALCSVRPIPGYEALDLEGVIAWKVVRNRLPHQRYWNGEPGSLRFRPGNRVSVPGLFLAGDWNRSELDFPCMENAVVSGRSAAAAVMGDLGGRASL